MSASTTAAEATAAQSKSQGHLGPDLKAYGTEVAAASPAAASRCADGVNKPFRLKRDGFGANSVRVNIEFRELMEEPPGGVNAGRAASSDPNVEGRHVPLGVDAVQAHDFVRSGGWTIVTDKDGSRAGIRAHRGILSGDEHVDAEALRAAVEAELGFTVDDVQAVFRQGRLSTTQGELRAAIDARLLALSRAGANLLALARVLGLAVKPAKHGGNCRAIDNALVRAKAAELQTEGRA